MPKKFPAFRPATPIPQKEYLYRILAKEDFRSFLLENGINSVVLDNDSFSKRPNSVGCFFQNGLWITYETDERSMVVEKASFQSEEDAFQNIAEKYSLSYKTIQRPNWLWHLLDISLPNDVFEVTQLIEKYLTQYRVLSEKLAGTTAQDAMNKDVRFLMEELSFFKQHFGAMPFDFSTNDLLLLPQNSDEQNANLA